MCKKVVVGLSGGVDSAVAALILLKEGYEVIGVSCHMFQEGFNTTGDMVISSEINDAKKIAEILGIKHEIVDARKEFKENVISYFKEEYINGRTPNPCVICNPLVKFKTLLDLCEKYNADIISTGHYANVEKSNERYSIKNAKYAQKDQTYALSRLTQDELAKLYMPLGNYSKDEVRNIAKENNLFVSQKKDSQDICFIENSYKEFLEEYVIKGLPPKGNFVDKNRNVLGEHNGISNYTYGQRRGLNIALGKRVFVNKIDVLNNEIVLGDDDDCFSSELVASNVSFMGATYFDNEEYLARIRYSHKGEKCIIDFDGEKFKENEVTANSKIKLRFNKEVRAVTPGQVVVIYRDDIIIASAIIEG